MFKCSILFIDDEESILSALRRCLRKEEYTMHFATSPAEALDILGRTPVDVVVSDHMMADTTGLEFLKMLKTIYPQVVRILLTGQADLELAVAAINEGGISRFLLKPWNDLELRITLKAILQQLALQRENSHLRREVERQNQYICALETEYPGITVLKRDRKGAIVIEVEET